MKLWEKQEIKSPGAGFLGDIIAPGPGEFAGIGKAAMAGLKAAGRIAVYRKTY